MATEKERLDLFRSKLSKDSDDTRECVKVISHVYGRFGLCGGMYNVSIIYNNKLSEVLHEYYKYDMKFFEKNLLSHIILVYLDDLYVEARLILDGIIKRMRMIGVRDYAFNRDMIVSSGIERYKELTDQIFEFDLKKDVDKCMNHFCLKESTEGKFINPKAAMGEMKKDLDTLGIDPKPIEESFMGYDEMEAVKAFSDLFSSMFDQMIEEMKKRKK